MRRVLSSILAAALVATTPLFAGSSLIRLTDRDDLFGWEAVGKVEIGNNSYCTGALIAPNLVLTAAHCVYDGARQVQPGEMRFRAGLRDGKFIEERRVARLVAHSGYINGAVLSANSIRHDAALLELEQAIPSAVASPFVLAGQSGKGQRVSVVSFGRGRDNALSWQRDCGITGKGQGLMSFDCNVTFGSSGAPVFMRENGRARIVSLISSGGKREGGTIAYGMVLPEIVDRLKRDLRAMPRASSTVKVRRVQIGQGGTASGAKFAKPIEN